MRTLWVCDVAGGPFDYVGTKPERDPISLEQAHRELGDYPRRIRCRRGFPELARSLDFFKVPEREKGEVLAAFAAHKGGVTEGSLAMSAR